MCEQRREYVAYLLRMWRARKGTKWSWRASLERVQTGERKGFASLEDLFAYLRGQAGLSTGSCPQPSPQSVPDTETGGSE